MSWSTTARYAMFLIASQSALAWFPFAMHDTFDTTVDQPVAGEVTVNDSDIIFNTASPMIYGHTEGTNGDVSWDGVSGWLRYTPNPGFIGEDSFVYTVVSTDPVFCDPPPFPYPDPECFSEAIVFVTVSAAASEPFADAGPNKAVGVGDTVSLDGGSSFDDETATESLLFDWRFASVPTGSQTVLVDPDTATPSFVVDAAGIYLAELTVTDEDGLTSEPDQVAIKARMQRGR